MARKVGDDFTVPLCRKHHRDLHDSGNESAWWHDMGIEPLEIARQLWEEGSSTRSGQPEPADQSERGAVALGEAGDGRLVGLVSPFDS